MPKIIVFIIFIFAQINSVFGATFSQDDIDRIYCGGIDKQGTCSIYNVSLLNLIATPERFNGKKIRVNGVLSVGHEHVVLRLSKDTFTSEAIWLSIQDGVVETKEELDQYTLKKHRLKLKYDNRRVWVEGIFDMNFHHPLFRGAIVGVTRID